jgi:uncharacterized small protein (DUF1192 family)
VARSVDDYLMRIQLQVQNDRALKQLTTNLERTAKAAPRVGSAMKPVTTGTRNFGHAAQNAGYQLQDFIVQVQGGVDPLRAMSMQLPQMLTGLGAIGAAVGVAVATLPAFIQLFRDGEEVTATWDEALAGLDSALGKIGQTASGVNLSEWIEQFNAADEAARKALSSGLQVDNLRLRREVRTSAGAITQTNVFDETPDNLKLLGRAEEARLADLAKRQEEYADSLGLSTDKARELNDQLTALKDANGLNQQAAASALSILEQGAIATGKLTEENDTLQGQLESVIQAQNALAESSRVSNQALSGTIPVLKEIEVTAKRIGESGSGGSSGGAGGIVADLDSLNRYSQTMIDLRRNMAWLAEEGERLEAQRRREIATNQEAIALWQQFNPELATYHRTVTELAAALEHGAISQERFDAEMMNAKNVLEGVPENFNLAAEGVKLFDQSFDTMLNGVLMGTRSMSDAFTDMAKVIIAQLLKIAAYQGIGSALSGAGGFWGEVGAAFLANADGNAFSRGSVIPFAKGGVVTGPTVFPMANGAGLMGEAGPEAVMPLKRGRDGKLGVSGGGMNVTINNMAAGVEVNARQGDGGLTIDVVMRQLGAAISRGGNDVSAALEGTYSLGRGKGVY